MTILTVLEALARLYRRIDQVAAQRQVFGVPLAAADQRLPGFVDEIFRPPQNLA